MRSRSIVLALCALVATAALAHACTDPPAQPPVVTIEEQGSNVVKITVYGYTTFGSSPGAFCACALDGFDCVTSVDSAKVVNTSDGTPVNGFDFSSNGNTSSGFNGVQSGNWSGFFSSVSTAIPQGTAVNICFWITSNCTDTELQENSAANIGTDEANSDGSLTGNHQAILAALVTAVPAMTFWGVLILALIMLSVAMVVRRRKLTA